MQTIKKTNLHLIFQTYQLIENFDQVISKLGKEPFPSSEKANDNIIDIDEQEQLYLDYLEKAKTQDFSEFKKLGAIYSPGLKKKIMTILKFTLKFKIPFQ